MQHQQQRVVVVAAVDRGEPHQRVQHGVGPARVGPGREQVLNGGQTRQLGCAVSPPADGFGLVETVCEGRPTADHGGVMKHLRGSFGIGRGCRDPA